MGTVGYYSEELFRYYYNTFKKSNDSLFEEFYNPFASDVYSLGLILAKMMGFNIKDIRKNSYSLSELFSKSDKMYKQIASIIE